MARPDGLTKFGEIAGAEMRWRYTREHPYGDGRTGERWLLPSFLDKLTACFVELGFMCRLGAPRIIVSAGAYVAKRGRHGEGRALDIDALWWTKKRGANRILVTKAFSKNPAVYLGVEAQLRRHCGTVLGYLYNRKHRGHWHIDDGSRVGYRATSYSRVLFVQASLLHIWGIDVGDLDGESGRRTRGGIHEISQRLLFSKPLSDPMTWQRYLFVTAVEGMSRIDKLPASL